MTRTALRGGDGQDSLFDFGGWQSTTDRLQFAAEILPSDLLLARDQENLILRIAGTSDQITLQYYFLSPDYRIEQFHFADGTIWQTTAIDAWLASGNANVPTDGGGYPDGHRRP